MEKIETRVESGSDNDLFNDDAVIVLEDKLASASKRIESNMLTLSSRADDAHKMPKKSSFNYVLGGAEAIT